MSTSTSTVRGIKPSVNENGLLGRALSSEPAFHTRVTVAETCDMSPLARKVVYLSLLAGVLFLVSVAAYVWYGFYQWQNLP